jgi:hypothetical protein
MSVVIGLFVGGTGKYTAQLLKGWSQAYGWPFNDYVVLDVDPAQVLAGPYALGQNLLVPDGAFMPRVKETIGAWNQDALAKRTADGAERAEASVMFTVGQSLAKPVLAGGGGFWTYRAMGLPGTDALIKLPAGVTLINLLRSKIQAAKQANPTATIELRIVGSSAGGTGAGFLVPLALKAIESVSQVPNVQIVPMLALSSTFTNVWGAANQDIADRGHSGTFALYRELDFLSNKPELRATPGRRVIPAAGGLRYFDHGTARPPGDPRPEFALADHIYWFGRRGSDAAASPVDTFQELARVYAALADINISTAIQGRPVFMGQRMGILPGAVSVEYRRLEVGEHMSGELLVDMLHNDMVGGPSRIHPLAVLERGTLGDLPLTDFLVGQRTDLFLRPGDAATKRVGTSVAVKLVRAMCPNLTMTTAQPVSPDDRGGFEAEPGDWLSIVNELTDQRDRRLQELTREATAAIDKALDREFDETQKWLRAEVVEGLLNRGYPLTAVRASLEGVGQELARVGLFFDRAWPNATQPDEQGEVPSRAQAEGALAEGKALLIPNEAQQTPAKHGIFARFARWFMPAATGGVVGGALFTAGIAPIWAVLGGIGVFALAAFWVGRLMRPKRKRRSELREEAVAELDRSYESVLLARALDHTGEATVSRYLSALVRQEGGGAPAGNPTELEALDALVATLSKLFEGIQLEEQGRLQGLLQRPPCVVAEVGAAQQIPQAQRRRLMTELRERLSFQISRDGRATANMTITNGASGQATVALVTVASAANGQRPAAYQEMVQQLEAAARTTTVGAGVLKQRFADVLQSPTELASLLQQLGLASDQRRHSCDLSVAQLEPRLSLLLVGSAELQAEVGRVMSAGLVGNQGASQRLQRAMDQGGNVSTALVCPNIGESVMLVDLWGVENPDEINDIHECRSRYYGLNVAPGSKREYAGTFEFHVIPELATAAHLEVASGATTPFSRAIVQRLRGCDPRLPGPTAIDLFYLARVAGAFVAHGGNPTGGGAVQEMWIEVEGLPGGIKLLERSMAATVAGDPFGAARPDVSLFDAFADFMAYDGSALDANAVTNLSGMGARLCPDVWQQLGQGRLREAQKIIRDLFYKLEGQNGSIAPAYEAARRLAAADSAKMVPTEGSQWNAVCRSIFDEAVRKLSFLSTT